MKNVLCFGLALASMLPFASAQEHPAVSIIPNGDSFSLHWPVIQPAGAPQTLKYQLERSDNLSDWLPFGVPVRSAATGQVVTRDIAPDRTHAFYRVSVAPEERSSALADGGEDVFGYSDLFRQELSRIGQITPQQFSDRYDRHPPYVPELDRDATESDFWSAFNTDPAVYNRNLIPFLDDLRQFDFRLTPAELAFFKKSGFVVSERLGAYSCGEIYNRLWIDDLPVFVTTDSLLQAWHRSYDMMLAEIESTILYSNLKAMLDGMAEKVAGANAGASDALRDSLRDADYFIAVARSLLKGTQVPSKLDQEQRVQATLQAITAEKLDPCFDLFGFPRAVDFSQFKPRGHYDDPLNWELQLYFKAVMWLGRIDYRVAGGPFLDSICEDQPHHARLRDLGTAIVLHEILRDAGQFDRWAQSEELISTFIGWTDSMTFRELGQLLHEAGINSLADVPDTNVLAGFQAKLELGSIGLQTITGDFFVSSLDDHPAVLPQSFTVFGQKFVLDSWALSQLVADRILWVENGITNKVMRRMPSALDVAFGVLRNDQVVPELVARMTSTNAAFSTNYPIKFRDGLPYQHNLAAVREVVEQHPPAAWGQNVYMGWLDLLRQLSPPLADDPRVPAPMRTRAWAMKDLNTQLAGWTELRHDTILYAKQSYTANFACSYPKGFIEPRTNFWRRLQLLAEQTGALIARTDYSGKQNLQTNQLSFLNHFADVSRRLHDMSDKELRQVPFSDADIDFISSTLVGFRGYAGYWTVKDGWYPKLFYQTPYVRSASLFVGFDQALGATRWDPLITDVHTDTPCGICDDPGGVLHEATGNVNLLLIAVDNGTNKCVYAGPVLSHYELSLPFSPAGPQRLSDHDWQFRFAQAGLVDPSQYGAFNVNPNSPDPSSVPSPSEWTREYLVERKP